MTNIPTGPALWREILESSLSKVHHGTIGQVVAFSAADRTVDVRPMVQDLAPDPDTGEETAQPFPVLKSVRIVYPGGGGMVFHFPLSVGDLGMIFYCDLPIDRVLSQGQEGPPVILDRHGIGAPVFYPGEIFTDDDPPTTAISAKISLGDDAGSWEPAAMGTKTNTQLSTLKDKLNALRTAINGWTPIAMDGGAGLKLALTAWLAAAVTLSSVDSTDVEIT